jgi:hypothetical protein
MLRFYGGLKVQPACIALFQQADCQPAFVLDARRGPFAFAQDELMEAPESQFRALGLRTTRILDSMNVMFLQWYCGGRLGNGHDLGG